MAAVQISWPVPMRAIGAQNLLTMPGGVSASGYLHKKGGSQFSLMKWPLRYIIIHKGCVYYFKTSTSPSPQGAFSLNGYNRVMRAAEETTSSNVFPFKIVHFSKRHRTWYFSAASEEERRKWMRHLRKEIDYYNDKRDFQDPSESDSDAESFYGQIESPLDIIHAPDNPEAEYMLQDEDSDEEDYLKPDGSPTSSGRSIAPPPSYPPPPVPVHPKPDHKGPPPPVPPPPSKSAPSPVTKKGPPPIPSQCSPKEVINRGPPPPLPSAPHLQKPKLSVGSMPPPPPLSSLKKQVTGKMSVSTLPVCERKPSPLIGMKGPATLPICSELESKMVLSREDKVSTTSHSHGTSSNEDKQSLMPMRHKPSVVPKPPVPMVKPKPLRPSLQRSSPDGQSFRSSVEENPLKKKNTPKNDAEDSDEDYENVQLPDSVFVETTETSNVEKLFKEAFSSPQDGLYCIRNSGTKTSKVLVVWDVSLNKARNYRLFEEDSRVFLEADLTFPSLAALVEHYYCHPLPNHGSLCLQKPYGYTIPR
ncbi:SH3 domain-binding protein 2 [Chanos chanos]|uniref:SH3 domain-binding protein 2 n=1 Tax=Chanos chanos TaxID=29144 RepID=A0A6J2V227_CHACN|nr:SH3 domain-binding protein 2 [Chanos chanos]